MKILKKQIYALAISLVSFAGCSDFEEINKDPNAVSEANVQVAHLLNKSIVGAQQNPHIAERTFILTWKRAARFDRASGFAIGADNDGWNTDYFSTGYAAGWLNYANQAINLGEKRVLVEGAPAHENNVLQMARIWRAYLITELADCFGPIPILNKYDGTISPYENVESIYKFALTELKDAASKLDLEADMSIITQKDNESDPFYDGDVSKWVRYATSMRMRLAMRLSVADNAYAKAQFEDAAKGSFISTLDETAEVAEKGGWDDLTAVMSRPWNQQPISVTNNNLLIGLGGVTMQVPEEIKSKVVLKDAMKYLGQKFDKHFPLMTNDPAAGYFFDALPEKIDPRAVAMYNIPGHFEDVHSHFAENNLAGIANLLDPESPADTTKYHKLNVKYTWNTWVAGKWDKLSDLSSQLTGEPKTYPSISKLYRSGENKRVWFAAWESYFLLAEAATYGWAVPGSAKSNYELGVAASFEYHKVSEFLTDYLMSTDYNRIGTSASFNHTTEAVSHEISYVDGYTGAAKTSMYVYPKNSIYKNGTVNNDMLTKIITQKYLAQNPWLPLEAWSDHRRLGLPFFENQAVEVDYNPGINEVALTRATAKECRWEFYPKRMRYPANMQVNNKVGYDQAMGLLGGENNTLNPFFWQMQP